MSVAMATGVRGLAGAFDQRNLIVVNRTTADTVVGAVLALDIAGTDGAVSTTAHVSGQASTDGTANVIADFADGTTGIHVVVLEVFADDAEGLVCVRGTIPVDVVDSTSKGDLLSHDGSNALDAVIAGDSPEAICLVPNTSGANALRLCMFDGINGFNNS